MSAVRVEVRKALKTYEILHSQLAGLVDSFEVFEYVVRVSVYHGNPEVPIVLVLGDTRVSSI